MTVTMPAAQIDLGVRSARATQRAGISGVIRIGVPQDFASVLPEVLAPLAVLGPKCAFRRCAIERLEAAHIAHRIAASSPSLDGLWAALRGGLGVTARTALNLPEGLAFDRILHGLPALGSLPVTVPRNAVRRGRPWIAWRRF